MKLTYNDLVAFFTNSIVSPKENKLGIEYEIFCLHKDSLKRLGYDSHPGIRDLIEHFVHLGFEPVYEDNKIIGANSSDYYITLEPGGQFEASFRPCKTIAEFEKLQNSYLSALRVIEKKFPVIFIAFGVDPINALEDVPWMPKGRYKIMQNYLSKTGSMGHMMMKQSAAIQVNIDYNSEADAVRKHNMIIDLYEPIMHMFSNSSVYEGKKTSSLNLRELIWQNTDPDRCGISLNNKRITSFSDYIDAALKVPMILLYKNNHYIEITRRLTFEEFMEKGYKEYFPDIRDWKLHLNMLYPHVRFNNKTLEIRLFDCNKPSVVLAIAALIKGLVYSNKNVQKLMNEKDILDFMKKALPPKEASYFRPIEKIINKNTSFAKEAQKRFTNSKNIHEFIQNLRVL